MKEWDKTSTNYCSRHLVKPSAPVKYTNKDGEIVDEQRKPGLRTVSCILYCVLYAGEVREYVSAFWILSTMTRSGQPVRKTLANNVAILVLLPC